MKKFAFILIALLGLAMACDDSTKSASGEDDTFSYGGWVYDIATGTKITSYKLTIETATASYAASVNATTGKYSVAGIPSYADYTVFVSATGYVPFSSTNALTTKWYEGGTDEESANDLDNPQAYIKNLALIPSSVTSAAVPVKVVDAYTGSPIASGNYKLVYSDLGASVGGFNTVTSKTSYLWAQDIETVGGTFTAGSFTIAAGALRYGYKYTLTVFTAAGYAVSSAVSIDTTALSSSSYVVVLSPTTYSSLSYLGQSNVDANGELLSTDSTARSVTFSFSENIELDSDWALSVHGNPATYHAGTTFITGVGTNLSGGTLSAADNDNDGQTQTLFAAPATTAATQWIAVSVNANTLTVTLTGDSSLLSVNDSQDDLIYALNISNIRIRSEANKGEFSAVSALPSGASAPASTFVKFRDAYHD